MHRFPQWIGNLIERLSAKWNTRISVRTRQGTELSERILFARGLPQGDALCPKLFTLCMNPIAWKLQASEGYCLSKPINTKITDLLYVDDLKVYAASEVKLKVVLREVQAAMGDIGLLWNERKCAVVNVKRGCLQDWRMDLFFGQDFKIRFSFGHPSSKYLVTFLSLSKNSPQYE